MKDTKLYRTVGSVGALAVALLAAVALALSLAFSACAQGSNPPPQSSGGGNSGNADNGGTTGVYEITAHKLFHGVFELNRDASEGGITWAFPAGDIHCKVPSAVKNPGALSSEFSVSGALWQYWGYVPAHGVAWLPVGAGGSFTAGVSYRVALILKASPAFADEGGFPLLADPNNETFYYRETDARSMGGEGYTISIDISNVTANNAVLMITFPPLPVKDSLE